MMRSLYNLTEIRKELSAHWGKQIRPKDSFVRGVIWELKDIGIKRAVRRLLRIAGKHPVPVQVGYPYGESF